MDIRQQEYQRGYAQIDLDAVVNNFKLLLQKVNAGTKLIAVIKADGYGHGSLPIARELEEEEGLFAMAVATFEEALILRRGGIKKPLLILGYTFPYCYKEMIEEEIRPTLFRRDQLQELGKAAEKAKKKVRVHIKVDTGMRRIGIPPDEEGLSFLRQVKEYENIEIEGIFTHFAKADEEDLSDTQKQRKTFHDFVEKAEKELAIRIPLKHCSNSAAAMRYPEGNMDAVRAGISLYGIYPSGKVEEGGLKPVLSLYSHIIDTKPLYPGQSVSYGGTFTAVEKMRIATIPIGYGDGYPRSLSGKGWVLICGQKAPILGRVCMDQFMVDITHIPGAMEGSLVTLLGRDGEEFLRAEELSLLSGRFHYELVCDIGKRIPRVYIKAGEIVGTKDYYQDFR